MAGPPLVILRAEAKKKEYPQASDRRDACLQPMIRPGGPGGAALKDTTGGGVLSGVRQKFFLVVLRCHGVARVSVVVMTLVDGQVVLNYGTPRPVAAFVQRAYIFVHWAFCRYIFLLYIVMFIVATAKSIACDTPEILDLGFTPITERII